MTIITHPSAPSKLSSVDLDNIVFGSTFTDHMFSVEYKNGQWGTPEIKPFANISLSPAAQVLHYGQAAFEGMKAYRNTKDEVFLFRIYDNFKRINESSKRLCMPEIPEDVFIEGLKQLVLLDKNWIPTFEGGSLYLRPFIFASEPMLRAVTSNEYTFMIVCSPAKAYYAEPLRIKIADHYSRAASGGVGYAKAAGNYAASFYPTKLAKDEGFDQVVWTDAATHSFIEEAGTMNVIIRIGDTLVTSPAGDTILNGVTRRSVLSVAQHLGIVVEERRVTVNEVIEGLQSGVVKEMFGCGTAVVIMPYKTIGYKEDRYDIPLLSETKSYADRIKKYIVDLQTGKIEDPFQWRTKL